MPVCLGFETRDCNINPFVQQRRYQTARHVSQHCAGFARSLFAKKRIREEYLPDSPRPLKYVQTIRAMLIRSSNNMFFHDGFSRRLMRDVVVSVVDGWKLGLSVSEITKFMRQCGGPQFGGSAKPPRRHYTISNVVFVVCSSGQTRIIMSHAINCAPMY